ncbi:helix-turn-helix domain-containing protein [Paenibacillus contaminans]|uniref:HTH araC/xylS-type domain-containing protein n=1 Tax=Paenibacillus contaminans TaxID=450362 RepID=A0A329M8P6_9BACL|nr:helix-turn-helix domain-containing protein [Paenibacillus contaminans]RAV16118.1 hypothetical protein DQG23_29465 [Paenibacillus contaminans]
MRKQWYYRLLFSYLPVFFIASSVVVIISIVSVRLTIGNEAKRVNEVATKQMLSSVDDALRSIDQLILKEILNNVAFDKFFDPAKETNKYLDSLEMSDRIRNIIHATPLIDSLYLYRYRDNIVLTRDERISLEQFPDKEFLMQTLRNPPKSKWSDLREVSEINVYSNEKIIRKVVTLTSKVPTISGGQGLIVVNVRPYAIQSMIEQMANAQYSLLDFVDMNNASIASIRETADAAGKIEKNRHSFVVSSEYTGWSMHSSINNDKVYGFSSAIFYICFASWVFAIAFGAYWIYVVTRRNYKPIEALTGRLEQFKAQKRLKLLGNEKHGEFDVIEAAIDQLIDQFDYQQLHREENKKYRQRKLLLELLEGNADRNDEWIAGMAEERYPSCIALVEIDHYAKFAATYNKRDQYLLKYAVECVFREVSQKHDMQIWAEWLQGNQMAVLFRCKKLDSKAEVISQEISDWVRENLDFTITIGVGMPVQEIEDIADSYESALKSVKMKFKLGSNRVIVSESIHHINEEELVVQPQTLRAIAQTFRQGDPRWSGILDEFVHQTTESNASKDNVLNMLNLVLFSVDREMGETSSDLKTIWKNGLGRLNEMMEPVETERELYQSFYKEMNEIFEAMNKRKDGNSQTALIYKVRSYLDERYEDPDMSLTELGDRFQINPSFLSRIFKEEIGVNITDYLIATRVEKAKQLLRDTQDTVQSISAKVGYVHAISFIRAFKKTTGLTPGEFRKISAEG